MSSKEAGSAPETSRRKRWEAIEAKHFGQCVWQVRSPNGRAMLEGILHKASGRILMVETTYDGRLPRQSSGKPWPEVGSVNVFAPLDAVGMTWDGLDAALASYGQKAAA